jgi:hypothetical protein
MQYTDMTLEASEFKTRAEDSRRIGSFRIRVLESPAGEMAPGEAVTVEWDDKDLQSKLAALDSRRLDVPGLTALGRTLAALLLPLAAKDGARAVREFLALSLAGLGTDVGLRLRLRLPEELAVIPWEFAYVERAGGDGMDGFLALDPRIAMVRHEMLADGAADTRLAGDIKVVAAFASAENLPELALDEEMKLLGQALEGVEGIDVQCCRDATLAKLQPLLPGAGVFHFAGHGDFTRQIGARPGSYTGAGFLAFGEERIGAEQMGINLRGEGVRLAVLAGCHTGRRDGVSVWSGIAPALVKARIPAVVANQNSILDTCALAFSRALYQALAGGLPVERAVAAGRIAIYNTEPNAPDWGVPVLYLRAADGRLFEGAADAAARRRAREAAEADVSVRVSTVQAGGILTGVVARKILEGKLAVNVAVRDVVLGEVTGLKAEEVEGGKIDVHVDVNEVGAGGSVLGLKLGRVGGWGPIGGGAGKSSAPKKIVDWVALPYAEPDEETRQCDEQPAPTRMKTDVDVGTVAGGQVIGTIKNENIQIGSVAIYNGANPPAAIGTAVQPPAPLIEETLRLDVASPRSAAVSEPFDVVIAVRQPDAPILAVADLDSVVSAEGSIFRHEEDEIVKYRIELIGADFQITPACYQVKLRPRENSRPVAFQVVATRSGHRSLLVNAYQEDGALAAQTRVTIQIAVAVAPQGRQ